MTEFITLNEYSQLSIVEKEKYILEKTRLEDLWVIGRVKNTSTNPFFHIEQLLNPYTGYPLPSNLFTGYSGSFSVFCYQPQTNTNNTIENHAQVATKIRLENSKKEILKGNIFRTNFEFVYSIEESDDLFELIGLNQESFGVLALVEPSIYPSDGRRFVELKADILKNEIKLETDALHKQLEQNQQQLYLVQQAVGRLNKTKESIISYKKQLEKLGFQMEDYLPSSKEKTPNSFLEMPETLSLLLDGIENQLTTRGFHYEEATLRQLVLSLMTEQMIVLSGPSGTGKTTIVKQLADILNAQCEIIPVQPSWTDKQDLLGFYNPIRKLYVPSPFLDCLIEAQQNPEQLYFICLDEINLAQIEYYLADLLSIRELKDGKLRLYSDFEYKQNMNEIHWFIQQVFQGDSKEIEDILQSIQLDTAAQYEMVTRFENLRRYTPELEIPNNIRIIGTMNVDGAVQALSPKVIDRSFIIPLYRQRTKYTQPLSEIGCYNIPADQFTIKKEEATPLSPSLHEAFEAIQKELQEWNLEFNERATHHILLYSAAASKLNISIEELVDDVTVTKLLPRVHDLVEDVQKINRLRETVETHVGDQTSSKEKLKKMHPRYEQTGLYSYWS